MNRQQEDSVCRPRRDASEETNSACALILPLQLPGRWHFVTAVQADEYKMEPANTAELVYWVFTSYHVFPLAILTGALQGPILGSLSLGDEDLPLTGRKWQGWGPELGLSESTSGGWGGEGQGHMRDGMTDGRPPAGVEGQNPDMGEGPVPAGNKEPRGRKEGKADGCAGDPGTG